MTQSNLHDSAMALEGELSPVTWHPIFSRAPRLEPVSDQAREIGEQIAHFAALITRIPATPEEAELIVQAFQLCERTHGFPAMTDALEIATALLAYAAKILRISLTSLAAQHGHANAGLWAGALVEHYAQVNPSQRRFPACACAPRLGSPNVEFDDVERALAISRGLGTFAAEASHDDIEAYAVLIAGARVRGGTHLLDEIERCASEAKHAPDAELAFIDAVGGLAASHDFDLPLKWRWFAAARRRGNGLKR